MLRSRRFWLNLLVTAVLLSITFWPLASAREALRAGMLPFFMGTAVWFFWLLLDGDGFLLLEEPELSLNEEIVRNLPLLIDRVRRSTKRRSRQILISTHSQALLENKGIDPRGVLRLERIGEGTSILAPTSEDMQLLTAGLSAAEVLLPKAHPHRSREMAL